MHKWAFNLTETAVASMCEKAINCWKIMEYFILWSTVATTVWLSSLESKKPHTELSVYNFGAILFMFSLMDIQNLVSLLMMQFS